MKFLKFYKAIVFSVKDVFALVFGLKKRVTLGAGWGSESESLRRRKEVLVESATASKSIRLAQGTLRGRG